MDTQREREMEEGDTHKKVIDILKPQNQEKD